MPSHIATLTATYIAAQMGWEASRHALNGEEQSSLFQIIAEIADLSGQYEVSHQPIPHALYRDLVDMLVSGIQQNLCMSAEQGVAWLQEALKARKRA